MLDALSKHTFGAILLAVIIEELGLPLPIPTDLMIVLAGASEESFVPTFFVHLLTLLAASAIGGTGLYMIVRRGGRPLVERVGNYVHLGPQELERAEAAIKRGGWGSIVVGRAIPGLRYATVVVCGLFKVPYLRYITAHVVGSSVYIAIFLLLGAAFGPAIIDRLHPSALVMHLLWLLLLAVGLPSLLVWLAIRIRQRPASSRRSLFEATLLGSFAGAITFAATLSVTATVAELFGAPHPLNVVYMLLGWLLGMGLKAGFALLLVYGVLLASLVGLGGAYFGLVMPYSSPNGTSLLRQGFGLSLLAAGVFGALVLCSLLFFDSGPLGPWWRSGGPIVVLGAIMGTLVYSLTTVCGRKVVLATIPNRRSSA